MFGEPPPSRPEQNGQRRDPEMTPSAIRKISLLPGARRQLSLTKHAQAPEQTHLSREHEKDRHTLDRASDMSQISMSPTESSASSIPASRYTISSSVGSGAEAFALPAKPRDSSSMTQQAATGQQPERDPAVKNNHFRKPSYATPVADFAAHRGQTAAITPPLVGDDLKSRLAGLKQFKAWSEKVHESSLQHEEALRKAKCQDIDSKATGDMIYRKTSAVTAHQAGAIRHDLPLKQAAEVIETSVDALTPFCSPQVTPVPIVSSSSTQKDTELLLPASPPTLNLQSRLEPESSNNGRLRASSRTIIISSTPVAELERLSRSRSNSRSDKSNSRSRSRQKEKKYPPVSFPKIYNEKVSENEPFQTNSKPQLLKRTSSTKASTPSISPMTKPTVRDIKDVPDNQEPLATPHDKRGRPVFYSTIHYYTECSHASPPATRPLDPDAQPRQDPDFHPTRPEITRSIIPGMCFNCDTAYRREKENEVVNACTGQVAEITNKLSSLVEQLELDDQSPSGDEDDSINDRHSARLHTPHRIPEDSHDLYHRLSSMSLPPISDDPSVPNTPAFPKRKSPDQESYQMRIMKQIRELEADIDKVRDAQDKHVKQVWAGYTRRWGPATLGVQRGPWSMNVERYQTRDDYDALLEHQRRSIDQRLAMPDEIGRLDDDDVQVVGVMDGGDADVEDGALSVVSNDGSSVASREGLLSRGGSRSVSWNGRGTPSTARTVTSVTSSSTNSYRDLPGATTPGEGKMKVGWIRE